VDLCDINISPAAPQRELEEQTEAGDSFAELSTDVLSSAGVQSLGRLADGASECSATGGGESEGAPGGVLKKTGSLGSGSTSRPSEALSAGLTTRALSKRLSRVSMALTGGGGGVGGPRLQRSASGATTAARAKAVPLLDFARLKIFTGQLLGMGSTARVYAGEFCGKPCAVKVLFTVEIVPEEIRRTCLEASLLHSLCHTSQHVVRLLGVAVLPPSLCVVLELCSEGSLSDIIHDLAPADAPARSSSLGDLGAWSSSHGSGGRGRLGSFLTTSLHAGHQGAGSEASWAKHRTGSSRGRAMPTSAPAAGRNRGRSGGSHGGSSRGGSSHGSTDGGGGYPQLALQRGNGLLPAMDAADSSTELVVRSSTSALPGSGTGGGGGGDDGGVGDGSWLFSSAGANDPRFAARADRVNYLTHKPAKPVAKAAKGGSGSGGSGGGHRGSAGSGNRGRLGSSGYGSGILSLFSTMDPGRGHDRDSFGQHPLRGSLAMAASQHSGKQQDIPSDHGSL